VLQQVIQRLEARTAEAAELKARLELTAQAESTAREERERLLADLERERERTDRLEEELHQAHRGSLRRIFSF
jgi:predicted nuclease with TOPRIM domain